MHVGKKTQKREKSAMTLSLYGSLVFAIVEIGMAVFSGSQAVLLDAVYDSVEFFMMLPSIFLIPLITALPVNSIHLVLLRWKPDSWWSKVPSWRRLPLG